MEESVQGNHPPAQSNASEKPPQVTRRRFLGLAATTAAAAVVAACTPATPTTTQPSAPTQAAGAQQKTGEQTKAQAPNVSTGGGELLFLTWTNFVPEMDAKLDELAKQWGDQNKVKVTVEHIGINDIPTRRAAAVTAKAGPDIIFDTQNWPQLFADSLVDVTDIAEKLDKELGGVHEAFKPFDFVDGKWRAIPNAWGGSAWVYRTDFFKEAGATVPQTWDDFLKMAAALKKYGKPVGQTLGHSFGDPPTFWYPFLWAHGGKEVEQDGKTVALDSPGTLMAVEKAVELFKTGLAEGVLAWDDNSNNRAYLAEEIGATLNGPSIYFRATQDSSKNELMKKIADNSDHFAHPTGPAGRFALISAYSLGIMNYSKNVQAAKELVYWLMQPAQYSAFLAAGRGYLQGPFKQYDNDPVYQQFPKLKPYQDIVKAGIIKWVGWPGPLSASSFRVYNQYIIVDLFAKACAGEYKPKDAINWAVGQLKGIYK